MGYRVLRIGTCGLISALTLGKVLIWECVAPIHDLIVPNGCSTVAIELPAQHHELATHQADGFTVVLPKISNGLEVRCQAFTTQSRRPNRISYPLFLTLALIMWNGDDRAVS